MALIRCPECDSEISDKARKCPNCGYEKSSKHCPECGKVISQNAVMCPECGYGFTKSSDNYNTYNGENYGLSIAGFVCSFLFPILGLIFGIMALVSNKGKQNTAKSFGLAATIISSIYLAIIFILMIFMIIGFAAYSQSVVYAY